MEAVLVRGLSKRNCCGVSACCARKGIEGAVFSMRSQQGVALRQLTF